MWIPAHIRSRWVRTMFVVFAFVAHTAHTAHTAHSADTSDQPEPGTAKPEIRIPPGSGVIEEFIGCELEDGRIVHGSISPADMPWRVAIGMPKTAPKFGSRRDGRDAAIAGMRHWERAIQTEFPWFELEFVEKDREAPVQIRWKRRTTGNALGRAGPVCFVDGDRIRTGGSMEVAVESCPTCARLEVAEVELLLAHEFGHILGLGHCLDCDSAMNYSWQTEGRVVVTQVDVDAVVGRIGFASGSEPAPNRFEKPGRRTEPGADPGPRPSVAAEGMVALAALSPAIHISEFLCEDPYPLKRACLNGTGPQQKREVGGIELLVAGTGDGKVLFVTPVELYPFELMANDRYYAVVEAAEAKGLAVVRATAMVSDGAPLGYWIEFDGDAWSALGL